MRIPSWVPIFGSKDEAATIPPVSEAVLTDSTKKKGSPLKSVVVILLVLAILGGGGFAVKKFVLKPKPETTTVATTTSPSSPKDMDVGTGAPATSAPATMKPDDGGSRTGTVIRAGMRGCGVNRSHIFVVSFPDGEKELRLTGVDSFHYGPITQRADDAANSLMAGKRIKVAPSEEEFFRVEGTAVLLADGRDMAVVLAQAGLVQPADGATDAVRQAAKEAEAAKRGIYGLLKS